MNHITATHVPPVNLLAIALVLTLQPVVNTDRCSEGIESGDDQRSSSALAKRKSEQRVQTIYARGRLAALFAVTGSRYFIIRQFLGWRAQESPHPYRRLNRSMPISPICLRWNDKSGSRTVRARKGNSSSSMPMNGEEVAASMRR